MNIIKKVEVDSDIFYLQDLDLYELILPFKWTLNIQIYYYYYYSKYIYQFFNNGLIQFKWLNLIDHEDYLQNLLNFYSKKSFENISSRHAKNKFLANSEQDSLANSIKRIGLFFPFFILRNNKTSDCLYFGKHRLYSILQNKEQFNKQNFLFLFAQFNQAKLKQPIDCYYFSKQQNKLYMISTKNIDLIWKSFKFYSEILPNLLYDIHIKPNPIFNNEKELQHFLEKPFKTIPELENFSYVYLL